MVWGYAMTDFGNGVMLGVVGMMLTILVLNLLIDRFIP